VQVVLDTNVLVSGLAFPSGPPGRIVSAWRAGAFSLVASEFMLDELARILPALSHRTGFSAADVRDFLDLMRAMSTIVELNADHLAQAQGSGLRDPDDAPILATLLSSGADCLVTGDKDLLLLAGPWAILSPADFCARHNP
jgi:putative PIN family toxin of toxin-antitoxin system